MGYIPIRTPGGTIWAEIKDTDDAQGHELVGIQDEAVKSFQEATDALKKNAEYLLQVLKALEPEEVEVSFGITVGIEAGTPFFGLAKASGESSYTVTIKWKDNKVEST